MAGGRVRLVPAELRALDDLDDDVLALSVFSDERPLEGLTGLVDWRLCGGLSRWFLTGFASGALGERILYPLGRRLPHAQLLLFGLGPRAEYRVDRALATARAALEVVTGLGARRLTCDLFRVETLTTPLERNGAQLLELFAAEPQLAAVHVVASEAERAAIGSRRA